MNTTQSGAIGVNRTQYMSSMVPAQALEQEAGQQYGDILKQAKAKNLLDRDPAQVARARTISQRLIAQAGVFRPDAASWKWEVHVLSSDEVNAWCMPGGKIAVYTGLLNKIKPTDDELAAVLGHEISRPARTCARARVAADGDQSGAVGAVHRHGFQRGRRPGRQADQRDVHAAQQPHP